MDKTERLGIVMTPTEKQALVRLAEHEGGLSYAATLRRLIRQEAKKHGLWVVPSQPRLPGKLHSSNNIT